MEKEQIIDKEMELIKRDFCTSLGYNCFAFGFHEQNEDDTRSNAERIDVSGWNLELFQHSENEEWVIWFWDGEGDDRYFGEFWLVFAKEKEAAARHAYRLLENFLRKNIERAGKTPPFFLEDELSEIFNVIWGRRAASADEAPAEEDPALRREDAAQQNLFASGAENQAPQSAGSV